MPSLQDRNKDIITRYFTEYWGKGNPDIVDELCADDFLIHYPMHGPRNGKEAAKKMLSEFVEVGPPVYSWSVPGRQERCDDSCGLNTISAQLMENVTNFMPGNGQSKAFPDLSFRLYGTPLIAEGDYVVGRWIGGGTHTGITFNDLPVGKLETPNTGKRVYFSGTTIFRLKDGKIANEIGEEKALTALQQLGVVEGPNEGKEVVYDDAVGL